VNIAIRIVGFFVALVLLVLTCWLTNLFSAVVEPMSFLFVLGVGSAGWLLSTGARGIEMTAKTLVGDLNPSEGSEAAMMARSGKHAYWWAALMASLFGLIQMLQNLEDPAHIGPAVAVMILAPLYAALFSFFVWSPLEAAASARALQAQ